MSETLVQTEEQGLNGETGEAQQAVSELKLIELVYCGSGMANVAFA